MDLTPAALQVYFTGLQTIYQQGYDSVSAEDEWSDKIAMTVPSDTELETYGWSDLIPKMREWVGPRVLNNLPLRSRSLTNKDWEETHSIPRNKFLDDKLGLYSTLAQQMGTNAKLLHTDQLAAKILENPVGFDGVNFFSPSHLTDLDDPGSATQSNLLNLALNATNYATAQATMRAFLGRNGRTYKSKGTVLAVPSALEFTARTIMNASIIAPATFQGVTQVGGFSNVLAGISEVVVMPELDAEPTAWYLLDCRSAVKPFVKQIRQAAQFAALTNVTDPNVFFNKEFIFGADARAAYDVTLWFKALKSVP